ncbi:helix-turn-helix domain-containing protein [Phocaeicola plebeius]|jgi:plasmid maintenance system antidote protein VapI|uniref:helix-turn-helix domain-containing protein n=1 Tax=Phocaeicola plebeius TaxID=310297 RepID=UPI000EC12900|nr:MAG TPA: LAMBDA REPRESSOR (TRIPLE MUTANT)/DNA COMPLEX-DNA COMPLEX, DOUBLE HELIX, TRANSCRIPTION-DNA.1A [Caudoviricetes sp.]HCW40038.1 hypothetical protein [Lachnospiraceae bacterium]
MKLCRSKIDIELARKQMSVTDLANVYGVSRSRMNIILNSNVVTPVCAGRVAKALDVDVVKIIEQ